mgnify:CR=1 FL=1
MTNNNVLEKEAKRRKAMHALFSASSVCIIGASSDPKKLSSSPLKAMELQKFGGSISLVNPKHL